MEEQFELDIKRLYLPIVKNFECCKCGHSIKVDLNHDYLSFPTVGKEEEHYLYCDQCDTEQYIKIKLKIDVEFIGKTYE